jgi:hypothetical protein
MFLELSRDKIMIVLELSRDKIITNNTPHGPSFLDQILSLIISNFHFWYHNHYSFNYLVILVTSTQPVLRTLGVSLVLSKRPSAYLMRCTHNALQGDIMNSFDSKESYFGCVSCFWQDLQDLT